MSKTYVIDGREVTVYPPTSSNPRFRGVWREGSDRPMRKAKTEADLITTITREFEGLAAKVTPGEIARIKVEVAAARAIQQLRDDGKSDGYIAKIVNSLRNWILPELEDLWLEEWNSIQSRKPINAARQAGRKQSTITDIGAAMRAVITYCHHADLLPPTRDPLAGVHYAQKSTIQGEAVEFIDRAALPDEGDADRIIKALDVVGQPRLAFAAKLVRRTALRGGEMRALKVQSVDFDELVLHVTETVEERTGKPVRFKPPKNGMFRDVPFAPSFIEPLRALCAEAGAPDALLFPGPHGTMQRSYLARWWRKAADLAGWPKSLDPEHPDAPRWTFHDLRHMAACWMLFDMKMDAADVSLVLGHASPQFTIARYVGRRGNAMARIHDALRDS